VKSHLSRNQPFEIVGQVDTIVHQAMQAYVQICGGRNMLNEGDSTGEAAGSTQETT
jgi:hypothetical protein